MILFFANFELPESCANATRVFAMAKMARLLGYGVDVLGVAAPNNDVLEGVYCEQEYHMIRTITAKGLAARERIKHNIKAVARYIEEKKKVQDIELIVLSNVYADYSIFFLKLSRTLNIPLVVNEVEWYDRNNEIFSGKMGWIKFIGNRVALTILHPHMKNIICISSLLDSYYRRKKCNTIVLPTLIDLNSYPHHSREDNDRVIVTYAGSPAKKDYITNAIKALLLLSRDERARIKINIYGCTSDQLFALGISSNELSAIGDSLECFGRLPYQEVKLRIAQSDFTVLLRPNKKYANAGFPTKVGESMACGTPVIANLTSDLKLCIINGKTGIICKDETTQSCADAFRIAINMNKNERELMRQEAEKMGQGFFSIETYLNKFDQFLTKCKN